MLSPRVRACWSHAFPAFYSAAVACVGSDGRPDGRGVGACVVAAAFVPGGAGCRHVDIRPGVPPDSGPVAVLGWGTGGCLRPMRRDLPRNCFGSGVGRVGTARVEKSATPCPVCDPRKPRSPGSRLDRPCARIMDEYPGKSCADGSCVRGGCCQFCGGSDAAGGGPVGAAGGRGGRMRVRYAGLVGGGLPFGFQCRSLRFRTLPRDGSRPLSCSARDSLFFIYATT